MKESSTLWINQNRLWIKNAAAAALLSIFALLLLTVVMPEIFSTWYLAATSKRPTLAEIERELAVEKIHRDELRYLLDSLDLDDSQQRPYQAILTAIRERCDRQQIALIGYDQLQQSQRQSNKVSSYRLLVEGRFHAMALLLADLEALPHGLTIQSLALEQKSPGSDLLRGVLVISAGVL